MFLVSFEIIICTGFDIILLRERLAVWSSAAWRERPRTRLRTIQTRDERQVRKLFVLLFDMLFFDVFRVLPMTCVLEDGHNTHLSDLHVHSS